jgi:hypothetical protein
MDVEQAEELRHDVERESLPPSPFRVDQLVEVALTVRGAPLPNDLVPDPWVITLDPGVRKFLIIVAKIGLHLFRRRGRVLCAFPDYLLRLIGGVCGFRSRTD